MTTVGVIAVTEGTGKNIATYEFTDSDALVKELQRIVLCTSSGLEITDSNNNINVHEQFGPTYEDNVAGVAIVESRYTPAGEFDCHTNSVIQAQAGGYIKSVSVSADPTGSAVIIVRDSATLGAGKIIKTIYVNPDGVRSQNFTSDINYQCTIGMEIDFLLTADNVRVQVFKR